MMKMSWFSRFSKYVKSVMASNSTAGYEKLKTHDDDSDYMKVKKFTYHELASATKNFTIKIGDRKYVHVYKGVLKSGEVVVVEKLKESTRDFDMNILTLKHSSLVNLIGYCQDKDQRLLVYEHLPIPLRNLELHLYHHNQIEKPIDWDMRIKIAIGIARGLEYLHCKHNPPILHRNLKASTILFDHDFNPKLSDIGLEFRTDVTRYYDYYCPPEYPGPDNWTLKCDIYTFGVVLLELITGRTVIYLVQKLGRRFDVWPFLKDSKKFSELVDPLLKGQFPVRSMQHVVKLASICVDESSSSRPSIDFILAVLEYSLSLSSIIS